MGFKIEEYPVNQYWIEIYCVPNSNGKDYLDDYFGKLVENRGYPSEKQTLELHSCDLFELRRKLYTVACVLTGHPKTYDVVYIPVFNKIKERTK